MKSSRALALAAASLIAAPAFASEVNELAPAGRYVFEPAQAACFESRSAEPPAGSDFCPIRSSADCTAGGRARLAVIACATLRAATATAHAHYQIWFQVKPPADALPGAAAATPSFVPIHVYAPGVAWDLKLRNGAIGDAAASSSARLALRLRQDPVDDLIDRGEIVTEEVLLFASHGGIRGCLSIPGDVVDLANLWLGCTSSTASFEQGRASPSLAAVVEVGRTYNLELALDFAGTKRLTAQLMGLEASGRSDESDPDRILPGEDNLEWSRFVITVGSDTSILERELEDLRSDFDQHGHAYRTGAGPDHNGIAVSTSRPNVPDGEARVDDADRDGVLDADDACPDSVAGAPVNALGCSLEAFCALHERGGDCRRADWDGDGSGPGSCAWQRQECRAAY
jgi:hypothetical protein